MPLPRGTVTRASRVTLPTHIFLSAGLASCWLIQPGVGTSASLTALSNFWPLTNTAIVLLIVAGGIGGSVLLGSRAAVAICLTAAAIVYLSLAGMAAGNHIPGASWGSCVLFVCLALYHFASVLSIVWFDRPGTGAK